MPKGIPVATMAIGNAENAGLLAVQMLAMENIDLAKKLDRYRKLLNDTVKDSRKNLT